MDRFFALVEEFGMQQDAAARRMGFAAELYSRVKTRQVPASKRFRLAAVGLCVEIGIRKEDGTPFGERELFAVEVAEPALAGV